MITSSGYVFTPASGQTPGRIDFSGTAGFDLSRLSGVKHLPTGKTLYAPLIGLQAAAISGSVITLSVDTTGMSASDPLAIAYATNALGTSADAAATSDAGTFSLIGLVKRGLGNWTTLLQRIPAPASGRVPVDGSGVTQPISGTVGLAAGAQQIGTIGNAFTLDATAAAGNTNTAAIAAAAGTPTDAATASGASTTVIGALRAIRDKLLAGLTVSWSGQSVGVSSLPALPAGNNAIGSVTLGAGSALIGTISNSFALDATITARLGTLGQKTATGSAPVVIASDQSAIAMTPKPASSGGASLKTFFAQGVANQLSQVKSTPGQVFKLHAYNSDTNWVWLKLYNTSGAPSLGTDLAVAVYGVPPGGIISMALDLGDAFSTGIWAGLLGDANPGGGGALSVANKCGFTISFA